MSITIGGYEFNGPFSSTGSLENRSGIYVILDHRQDTYYVLDVGESSEVKNRIENHDRKPCWQKNSTGKLSVAVYYTTNLQQQGRMQVEQKLREQYNPTCGDR